MKLSQTRINNNETSDMCRLCLCTDVKSRSIFREGPTSEHVRSRILDCCPISLFEDVHLPNSICRRCEDKLDVTYEFRQLCRESERVLRARYEFNYFNNTCHVTPLNRDVVRGRDVRTGERGRISTSDSIDEEKLGNDHENETASHGKDPTRSSSDERRIERTNGGSREESAAKYIGACIVGNVQVIHDKCEDRDEETVKPIESLEVPSEVDREFDRSVTRTFSVLEQRENVNLGKTTRSIDDEQGKPYLCDVCSKTFASKSGLRFHLKSHVGTKPYSCRYCSKRFTIPSYVKRHERIHGGDKPFICHVCSAAFASSNGLRYHLRSHTGEANYRCEICGKTFCRHKYLKEHIFTHTGEKPFVCRICGTGYGSSGSLFVHEKKCKYKSNVETYL
ncbi:PREDICTED: zinc finger protein 782-like [Dufourea novaeangliae]|uniref:zinc finger protein 782-like n=1 Tax=Dufourea novaeangliae TaxID=178035 RepID=UPI0007671CAA|nr:PREDICTED: zinc finger protein 782-like [Dufourea novaeangliae]